MNEVIKFLEETSVQFFATVDEEGHPKVRPFQFMLEKDGKLFFCTSSEKNVYKELQNNSYIQFTSTNSVPAWIRVSGKAVFVNDIDVKSQIIKNNDLVKAIYKTPNNPVFEVFYIENVKAVISDFSGQPSKEYNL